MDTERVPSQFSPFNANEVTIASDMSQLFRSTDAGASWQTVDFRQIQGNHESRVQFTEDPNIRYSLDYSNVAGSDLTRPSKSTDGGLTWQPMSSGYQGYPFGGGFYVPPIVMDPSRPNRLYSGYSHVVVTDNDAASWSESSAGIASLMKRDPSSSSITTAAPAIVPRCAPRPPAITAMKA